MKNKIIQLVLLLVIVVSCKQAHQSPISIEDNSFDEYFFNTKNIPVVKGQILNWSENDKKYSVIHYFIVSLLPEQIQIKKSCKVNPDGTFELELDNAFPYQQIWIKTDKFFTGVYVNSDLFIELYAKILQKNNESNLTGAGIKYSGTDGVLNTYMNKHVHFKREKQVDVHKKVSRIKRDRTLDNTVFISQLDSLYSILNSIDNMFIEENPSEFAWIIKHERLSKYYATICLFHWGKIMAPELFEKVKNHKVLITSNAGTKFYRYLYSYLSGTIYATGKYKYINFESYKSYSKLNENQKQTLDNYISFKQSDYKKSIKDYNKFVALSKEVSTFLHDTIIIEKSKRITTLLDSLFEPTKADYFKTKIQYEKDEIDKKHQIEFVINSMQTKWCEQIVLDNYNDIIEKTKSINVLLKGNESSYKKTTVHSITKTSFGAEFSIVDSTDAKSFLTYLRNSYSGKALIIDFWATWCGPCISGLKVSKNLVDESVDLPVEFIYLCTSRNSNIDKWKTKIEEIQLAGKHFFVEQDIETELMKLLSVSEFPSCVFIDKNGNYKHGEIASITQLDKNRLNELINE